MTQKFEAFIGLCIVLCAATFIWLLSQSGANFSSSASTYTVNAAFSDISGITTGSDIKMSGVKIGTVTRTSLTPEDYQAQVELAIDNDIKIPTDSIAKIASDSLLGGASIHIEAGFEEAYLKENAKIINTQSSVSLMSLISKAIFSAGGK